MERERGLDTGKAKGDFFHSMIRVFISHVLYCAFCWVLQDSHVPCFVSRLRCCYALSGAVEATCLFALCYWIFFFFFASSSFGSIHWQLIVGNRFARKWYDVALTRTKEPDSQSFVRRVIACCIGISFPLRKKPGLFVACALRTLMNSNRIGLRPLIGFPRVCGLRTYFFGPHMSASSVSACACATPYSPTGAIIVSSLHITYYMYFAFHSMC